MPKKYTSMKVEKRYKLFMSRFSGKETPKPEKNCTLWNSILIYTIDKLDFGENDSSVGRWNSTNEVLVDYFEKGKTAYNRLCTAMDVLMDLLATSLKLERMYQRPFCLQIPAGRFPWTDHNFLPQMVITISSKPGRTFRFSLLC